MKNISLDFKNINELDLKDKVAENVELAAENCNILLEGRGKGSDFRGWINLPDLQNSEMIKDIIKTAEQIRNKSEIHIVIGIGGSYLGAKALLECFKSPFQDFDNSENKPAVIFAGYNLSSFYLEKILSLIDKHSTTITVISKSGTTTEPAISFRFIKEKLEYKYGEKEAAKRIYTITDKSKGALKKVSEKNNYKSFVIPDDVGGRYSVLSPVGMLPLAVGGVDILSLLKGAEFMKNKIKEKDNIVLQYAAIRYTLYKEGKKVELLADYDERLSKIGDWWVQLFGESEGKEGKGIFPSSVSFTTDLHSLGQYIQEGENILFETVLAIENRNSLKIPLSKENDDNLNYLAGKDVEYVNDMAKKGTSNAHMQGKVPVIEINIPELNEFYLGSLIFFFELSCAVSGYMLDINPFNQPGVEAYKSQMFKLLSKPGF